MVATRDLDILRERFANIVWGDRIPGQEIEAALDRLEREWFRLQGMMNAANIRLHDLIPHPCADHDCLEHAWWDLLCGHARCTVENPNFVEVDGRRYSRRGPLSYTTDWTADTITAQLDEHGNVWILEPIGEE